MTKHIIVINGTGGSGKDTMIDRFSQLTDRKIANISTVDKVKEAARLLGWDGNKTDTNRAALSELKKLSDAYWNTSMADINDRCKHFLNSSINVQWMFIHCREPENIAKIVSAYNAKAILITRDGIDKHGNDSDDNVTNYKYDMVFENNGDNIIKNGRNFAVQVYKLFGENPNKLVDLRELVHTNITGRHFSDAGQYGLDGFTVKYCEVYYAYNDHAIALDGTHWFKHNEITIGCDNGIVRTIPFCPWHKIIDIENGNTFKNYYDDQPW